MSNVVWSGYLTFGLVSIPVELYSAARPKGISFKMLHRSDLGTLKQQYACTVCGEIVPREDITKGYEYEKGKFVTIEPADVKAVEPETAEQMEILQFVPMDQVDPLCFDSSYYLMPESDAANKAYALFALGLASSDRFGVAKLSMHNREYTVLLRPYRGGMLLHTLYLADEIRECAGFAERPQAGLQDSDLGVMRSLIDAMSQDWDLAAFSDGFQTKLTGLIENKLAGVVPEPKPSRKRFAPVVDLLSAIKASVESFLTKKKAAGAA